MLHSPLCGWLHTAPCASTRCFLLALTWHLKEISLLVALQIVVQQKRALPLRLDMVPMLAKGRDTRDTRNLRCKCLPRYTVRFLNPGVQTW